MTKITIDMYSGRPNPEIELTQEEDSGLVRLVTAITRDIVMNHGRGLFAEPSFPHLGYRGFTFQWGGSIMTAFFHCYKGLYFKTNGDTKWILLEDLGVEKYLKAISHQHGYDLR